MIIQPSQNEKAEKIKRIKDEIHHLKEYLLSDCCKQCAEIVSKIEDYQNEIKHLEILGE